MSKILEAVQVFKAGLTGNPYAQAKLAEALTTSDFAPRLAQGFEVQMLDIWKNADREWVGLSKRVEVPSFETTKLGAFLGGTDLLEVNEGEEYRAQAVAETRAEIQVKKYGRRRPWTWELQVNRQFSVLANIPRDFADGAVRTENSVAFAPLLNADGSFNERFFTGQAAPTNLPLTAENLEQAYNQLQLRTGIDGRDADVSDMYLVVHPANLLAANRLINAERIEVTEGKVKTTESNPFRGMFKVIAPKTLAKMGLDPNAWFLLPGAASQNPALGIAFLQGYSQPDIRVKNDQGYRPGGGTIAAEEGSFLDDTIQYRVRHTVGGASLFNNAAYASAGK